ACQSSFFCKFDIPDTMAADVVISRKKPVFPLNAGLQAYLKKYQRAEHLPLSYQDMAGFTEAVPLIDRNGKDTLWECPIYPPSEINRIHEGLKMIYAQLKASGNLRIVQHKAI